MLLKTWPEHSLLETLAYGIRGAIRAAPGHHLVIGDLSQIEARMVSWLAGNEPMLRVFADPDRDPYLYTADRIGAKGEQRRQLGKVLVLACGFGMRGQTFVDTAAAAPYYVVMTLDEGEAVVAAWRAENPLIENYWYRLGDACIEAVETGDVVACLKHWVTTFTHAGVRYLGISLPSGRWLLYPNVKLQAGSRGRPQIVYTGMKGPTRTYGAKLVENTTQASARDVMAHGMLIAEADGFRPVGHVHDEVICEQPVDDEVHTPDRLEQCLTVVPPWAEGLPLAAECKQSERYAKL